MKHRIDYFLEAFLLLAVIAALLVLAANAQTPAPQQPAVRFKPQWQGQFIQADRIADTRHPFSNGLFLISTTTIVGITPRVSLQLQILFPVGRGWQPPMVRTGMSVRIF